MIGLIPLFVLIVTFLMPALFIMRLLKSSKVKNKRIVKGLLIVYFAILFISVIVYELLPNKEFTLQTVNEKEADLISNQLYDDLFNGRPEKIDPLYLEDTWSFDYTRDKLKILQPSGFFEGTIVIERKPDNDGKIEGTYYRNTIVGGVDLTEEMEPTRVKLEDDVLELHDSAGTIAYNYAITKKEFVINQFTGKGFLQNHSNGYSSIKILYLRIPKNLDIINNQQLPLHYVGT